jgi:hypothetical protein
VSSIRPVVLAAVAWAAGAATAVGVGLVALSSVGASALTGPPDPPARLSAPDPASPTVTSTAVSPTPPRTSSAGSGASSSDREFTSTGGTVVARCVDGQAYLVAWSPAQGYHTDSVERGPAPKAKVEFEGQGAEVELEVICVGGVPQEHGG